MSIEAELQDVAQADRIALPIVHERLHFLGGHDFVEQETERVETLLGTSRDCVIPKGGLVVVGGEGGSGKTSTTLDAMAHLATGAEWLGIEVARPIRIGFIENEGPKAPFIEKVKRLADAWQGGDFLERCFFSDKSWGRFTLADEGLRRELRAYVEELKLDLIVCDPLGRFGIEGVGSPEETRAFLQLLGEVGCQRDVAFWLLHHVNKQRHRSIVQGLSGDWGGHPDLILGVEHEEGQRVTKLTFGKVRWGDAGRRALLLGWLPEGEGIGYRLLDADTAHDLGAQNRRRVLEAIENGHRTAAEIAPLVELTPRAVKEHMKALKAADEIELETGPNRTYFASPMAADGDEPGKSAFQPEELEWR